MHGPPLPRGTPTLSPHLAAHPLCGSKTASPQPPSWMPHRLQPLSSALRSDDLKEVPTGPRLLRKQQTASEGPGPFRGWEQQEGQDSHHSRRILSRGHTKQGVFPLVGRSLHRALDHVPHLPSAPGRRVRGRLPGHTDQDGRTLKLAAACWPLPGFWGLVMLCSQTL